VGWRFAFPLIFELERLSRQQSSFVVGTHTERILPAWDITAQLSETAGSAEGGGGFYFQLTHSITAYSHKDGDLIVYEGPAS
jgi:hypothetical protein